MNGIYLGTRVENKFSFDKTKQDNDQDFILYCGYDNIQYWADGFLVDKQAQYYIGEFSAVSKACRTGDDEPVQGGGKQSAPKAITMSMGGQIDSIRICTGFYKRYKDVGRRQSHAYHDNESISTRRALSVYTI